MGMSARSKFTVFGALPATVLFLAAGAAFTFGQDVSQLNGTQEQTDYLVVASNSTSSANSWQQVAYVGGAPGLTGSLQNIPVQTKYGELPQWFQVNTGAKGVPSAVQESGDLAFINAASSTTSPSDTNNGNQAGGTNNLNVVQAIHVRGNITNVAALRQAYRTCLIPIRLWSTTDQGATFLDVTQDYLDTHNRAANATNGEAPLTASPTGAATDPFYVDCSTGAFEFTVPTDASADHKTPGTLAYEVSVERGGVFATANNNTGAQPEFVFQATPLAYDPTNQNNTPGANGNGQYTPNVKSDKRAATVTVTADSPSGVVPGDNFPTIGFSTSPNTAATDWIVEPTCATYDQADTAYTNALSGAATLGSYITHCSGGESKHFTPAYANGVLVVGRVDVVVTADSPTIAYGDSQTVGYTTATKATTDSDWTGSGGTPPTCGVYASSDASFRTKLTTTLDAGTYVTHCIGGTSPFYNVTSRVDGTLTINKAAVTVTAETPTAITYGDTTPTIGYTTNPSTVAGDWSPQPTCAVYDTTDTTYSTALTGTLNVGTYVTHCDGGTSTNYNPASYTDGALTVTQKDVTVTAATPTAITYGDSTPTIGYTTSPSTVAGDWTSAPTCAVYDTTDTTYATPLSGTLDTGSYATQCSGGTATNYNPTTYTPGTLTVNQKDVTVTAETPTAITYGDTTPTIGYTTSPSTVAGDWTSAPTCAVYDTTDTTYATPLSGTLDTGSYATQCSGGTATNYNPTTYTPGTLTVIQKAVTVTADTPFAITYGDTTPTVGYTTSPSTVAGNWTTEPTCAVYATTDTTYATPLSGTLDAGSYATQCSGGTGVNFTPTTFTPGTLNVGKKAVTVNAETPANIAYGTTTPAIGYTTNPTTSAGNWTTEPTCAVYATTDSTYATPLSGTLAIDGYVTHCTGGTSTNYNPTTYTDGTLTVTKKNVTVTAASPADIAYGTATPAIGYTTSPSTAAGDWTTEPTCAVYATTDTGFATPLSGTLAVDGYVTHCDGGTSTNYNPSTYTDGTLNVTKKNLTVTAESPTAITYGDSTPTIGYTTSPSTVSGDWSVAPVCGIYDTGDTTFGTPLTPLHLNAGLYVTQCSGGTSAKYNPSTYTPGSLTVNKQPVALTADSPSDIVYGTATPTFSYTTNPTTSSTDWSVDPTCAVFTAADTTYASALSGTLNAGTFVTHCSGGAADNYIINSRIDGALTVTKRNVSVTAATPSAIAYGDSTPAITYTTNPSTVAGDWSSEPTCAVYATADTTFATPLSGTLAVGLYVTHCAGGTSTNYKAASYVSGALTVNKKDVTVTAATPSAREYGDATPAITYTTAPSTTSGDWTSEPTCAVYATADTGFASPITGPLAVGTYVTHCAGGTAAGYNPASYSDGSLTVNKKAVTVTAATPTAITFNEATPAITYTTTPSTVAGDWSSEPTCTVYATADTGFATALTGTLNAGTYVTHCSGGTANNYQAATYTDGSLTVNMPLLPSRANVIGSYSGTNNVYKVSSATAARWTTIGVADTSCTDLPAACSTNAIGVKSTVDGDYYYSPDGIHYTFFPSP